MSLENLHCHLHEAETNFPVRDQYYINQKILIILQEMAKAISRLQKQEECPEPPTHDRFLKFTTVDQFCEWLPFCKASSVYKMLGTLEEDEKHREYMEHNGRSWLVHPRNLLKKMADQQCEFPILSARARKYLNAHPVLCV